MSQEACAENIQSVFPFDQWLFLGSMVASIIGLVDSIYLAYVKLAATTPLMCAPGGGCDIVNNSPYSEFLGIPIAILGAGAYLVLIGLMFVEKRFVAWQYSAILAQLGVSLAGVLYSAYLTYLELAVIHAICPYCVVSAIAITFVFVFALIRLVKYEPQDGENL